MFYNEKEMVNSLIQSGIRKINSAGFLQVSFYEANEKKKS